MNTLEFVGMVVSVGIILFITGEVFDRAIAQRFKMGKSVRAIVLYTLLSCAGVVTVYLYQMYVLS